MTRDRDRGRDKDRDRDRVQHSLEALDCWADYRGGYLLHLLNSSRNQHQKKLTVQRVAVEHSHIAVALDYLCHAQTDNSYNNTYNNSYNSSTDFHGTRTNSRNDPDSESASSSCGSPANRAGAVGCCVVLLDRLPVRGVVPTNEDVVSFCEAIFRNNSNCNSICNSNINSNSNSDQRFGLESAEIDATAIRSSPNRPELTGVKVQYFSSLLTQMQFFKTSETNFDTVDNSSGATANQSEFLYISDASGCIFIYYYSREETSNSWQLMFRYELINNSSLIMSYISSTSHLRNNYYYSVPFSYINIDEQSIVWYVEINETENKHDKEKPLNRITPSNSYKLCISSIKISLSSNSLTIGKPMVIMNSENSSSFGRIERVTISSGGVWCITKTLADSAGNTMRNTITNCTSYQVYFYNYSTCRISELVVPEQFLEHDSSTVLVDTCETGHCVAESHQYYYHPLNKDSKSHLIMHIDAPIRPGAEVDSCDAASYLGYIVCLEQYNDIIKISNNIAVASIVSKTMLADHCSDRISDIKALKSIQDNYFFIALSSKRQVIVTKLATSSSIRSSEKMVKQLYKTFDNYCKAFALPNIYYTYSNKLTRKLICVSENLQGDSIHRSSESNFPDLILMGSSFVCGIRSKV